ncbi:LacI family DNA-binding transcriptional regulator [Halocynthiibacter sp. C4]|uniref:LacI family DNA-binding transcriptional regulator n=1 Tax=Halocynthiibacter sp. C4 TaxID=2992758 RepID=UPI00237A5195|nr:LacI family DNA-binding transcriptional regulator [Halocynthiibacter sp. C4]MDE0590087.1 LacI family DNA-binding transcriptional regulator [Halocynthiibacter sp. C4]
MEQQAPKPATIEDVAKLAGVSIATVSRAIRTPEKVAESTRKKVTAAIARTGYTANAMAQNLRMQRSQMVMVLAQSISDPNFPGILTGLEKVAKSRGYGVLIGNTEGDVSLEEKHLRFLSTGMADALILLTGHLPVAGWLQSPTANFPPMVAAARPVNRPDISYVGVDDAAAAKVATDYLISLGHERIVYVSGPAGDALSENRHRGYCDALSQAYDQSSVWRIQGDGTTEGGRSAIERLFIRDTLPTAFFCYNDNTAIGVIAALQSRGFDVPHDFSVVGFDDIPFASNITPSLTTIRQPRSQIGEIAMAHLLDFLPTRTIPVDTSLLHGDLIVRGSCSVPRITDKP